MGEPSHHEPTTLVAGDLMIVGVEIVTPDMTVKAVAQLFLEKGLSVAPVVDKAGAPVGMISDEDLLESQGERRRWWLQLLTSAESGDRLGPAREKKVQAVMSSPAITVEPFTPAHEIAELLEKNNLSSLPVIDGGKLVGLVGRDDLFGAFKDLLHPDHENEGGGFQFFESLFAGKKRPSPTDRLQAEQQKSVAPRSGEEVSADDFRRLMTASQESRAGEKARAAEAVELETQRRAKELIETHLTEDTWRSLVETAKHAAERSETELMLIQFPAKVCTDGGRALGVKEDGWEKTLRGEPAEIYARWDEELKSKGFGLNTRVEVFEDGKVRDYGLVLTWGQ